MPPETDWLNRYKNMNHVYYLQDTHLRPIDIHRLKVREQKKIFNANANQKKARVAILISNKTAFKTKTVTRDKKILYND